MATQLQRCQHVFSPQCYELHVREQTNIIDYFKTSQLKAALAKMSPLYLLKVTILTVVCVCGVTYSQTPLWMRRKPVCPPAYKINVAMRFDGRPNFLRGPCSISGPRRDTCRRRMSCCENSRGVHLCIRARVYQPKYRTGSKSHPQSPPPPPPVPVQSSIMLNDMDFGSSLCPNALAMHGNSGKACGNYDKLHTPCQDTFMDCPGDRVCCKDPCYKGKGSPKLCFPLPSQSPFASFPLGGNFLSNDIHYLPLMNTHQKKSNEPPTTKLPPTCP
ncbi:hypothetical protein EB796_016663 [Bugula neritina]|uniref:Uncharacterized protein n=1 Tax=Bugula neritina TaxID=10212 RepID=A0A7J7JHM0_BUGNE|nr:hypothetical protein EB796_016663 [Bugula neritina]